MTSLLKTVSSNKKEDLDGSLGLAFLRGVWIKPNWDNFANAARLGFRNDCLAGSHKDSAGFLFRELKKKHLKNNKNIYFNIKFIFVPK